VFADKEDRTDTPGAALILANHLHLHHASHLYCFFRPLHISQSATRSQNRRDGFRMVGLERCKFKMAEKDGHIRQYGVLEGFVSTAISSNVVHSEIPAHSSKSNFGCISQVPQDPRLYINTVRLHRIVHHIRVQLSARQNPFLECSILGCSLRHTRLRQITHSPRPPRVNVHPPILTHGFTLETTLWTRVALWGRWF
jgi:hypothetical protein